MNKLEKPSTYYRRELKLDFPSSARFVYCSSNNMTANYVGSSLVVTDSFDCEVTSQDVIVVGDIVNSNYLLVGALTAKRSLTYLSLKRRNQLFKVISIEQPMIQEGEKPEKMVVLQGKDWRELLEEYAEKSAKLMGVKPIDAESNLIGYCTWYYYYADVSEKNFLENVDALAAHPKSLYSKGVAQIDDGYQTFQGDWLDQDESWPTPLKEIAEKSTAKGQIPGIWLMPMVASTASRVFREHPDWFVHDDNDNVLTFQGWSPPPDNHWCCLDATRPEVRRHLANVFKTFRNWGFRYFKLDGLGFGLPEGKRSDPKATAVSAFRLALKAIREAVPDSYILGCCPPFMACLGYVDGCRVSGDTKSVWCEDINPNCDGSSSSCNLKNAFHITISNWWKFDRWFRCDPDAIIARQDKAVHTIGEARISILSGIMTGVTITSDNLGTIAPDRLKLLEFAAKTRLRNLKPLQWVPFTWAKVWEGDIDGKRAIAFVNDGPDKQEFLFEEFGFEDGKEILQNLGKMTHSIALESHDAAIVIIN